MRRTAHLTLALALVLAPRSGSWRRRRTQPKHAGLAGYVEQRGRLQRRAEDDPCSGAAAFGNSHRSART